MPNIRNNKMTPALKELSGGEMTDKQSQDSVIASTMTWGCKRAWGKRETERLVFSV